jgi:hypothetical protein
MSILLIMSLAFSTMFKSNDGADPRGLKEALD